MRRIRRKMLALTLATIILPAVAHAGTEAARGSDDTLSTVETSAGALENSVETTKSARHAVPKHYSVKKTAHAHKSTGEVGLASWYGGDWEGRRTASGESLDGREFTAAHRTLPLHSRVRVTNLANGRSIMVRITDRGPHRKGRIIDLSQSAAEQLGMKHRGVARVRLEPMSPHMINTAG
ncbi:MAG: septal ring lytic transglycosylase RlpA family protein [Alphaproteobacteria bacterium]|nr:septal ring lytic transglycosylase RlpA family protein [Alphaproteobacteria bacterium]